MDTNFHALAMLVDERLTRTREAARHQDLLALARPPRRRLRPWLGGQLIALGHWLRGEPDFVPAGQP
jgi:hypothetical protein